MAVAQVDKLIDGILSRTDVVQRRCSRNVLDDLGAFLRTQDSELQRLEKFVELINGRGFPRIGRTGKFNEEWPRQIRLAVSMVNIQIFKDSFGPRFKKILHRTLVCKKAKLCLVYKIMTKSQVDKKTIVIGFDMDGVIIDHAQRKVELAKNFGFKIKKSETPSEIIKNMITPLATYQEFQRVLYDAPETALHSPLMPGVKIVLAKIKKLKIPCFLISRRKKEETAIALLIKHGLWPKYFNKQNTFFVLEPEDKEVKAKALGVTHYIDDERKVLDALHSVSNKILFDNLGVFKNPPYRRIKSWKEVIKLI